MICRWTALLLLSSLAALAGSECTPSPALTACGTWGGECTFDLVPQFPAALPAYRPTIVWPKLELTWTLAKPWQGLGSDSQREVIRQVLETWSIQCPLVFTQVEGQADITICFESGDLGDGTRFDQQADPRRNELARAFMPGTSRAGLIQLDAGDTWSDLPAERFVAEAPAGQVHLFSVLLHEVGHALGLEHINNPLAIMSPENSAVSRSLSAADIQGIQALYGSRDGSIVPQPVPAYGQLPAAPGDLTDGVDQDSDGDGLPNALEILALDTDPNSADSDGDGIDDYTEVFVTGTPAASDAPIARARAVYPSVLAGWGETLDGGDSQDPSGLALQYRWRQTGGEDVALVASNTMRPSFIAPLVTEDTALTFELTVTNAKGRSSSADVVTVMVLARYRPDTPPVADAGDDAVAYEGASITLDGTGSYDPNSLELTYRWTQMEGQMVDLSNTAAQCPILTAPQISEETTLAFQLAVSNGSQTATDTVSIIVRPLEADSDGDGLTDGQERDFYGTDPDNADSDGDNVMDGSDSNPRNAAFQ